ncbi:helix-turn-helix transcriptional regulator [uncultured Tenacibaculum sp.]|uniref:helix-turn-helix domain-containing protein n=1 Tax=uncultured Tenacibaculum sp. TaxID=174713 RepID=UPI0026373A2F|nr:helix-turn-helix transcriptional regulator [uncultured Tenacibaculum sp.]
MTEDFISLNINHLVGRENLAKDAFGKIFGLNRGAISSYIDGKAKPKIDTLRKISEKYKISIDDIVNKNLSKTSDVFNNKVSLSGEVSGKLTIKEIEIVREAILMYEKQLLDDPVFNKWLDLKLTKKENEIHREYQKLRN